VLPCADDPELRSSISVLSMKRAVPAYYTRLLGELDSGSSLLMVVGVIFDLSS
jgi:hypothetical protein